GVYFTPTLPIGPSGSGSGKNDGSEIRSYPTLPSKPSSLSIRYSPLACMSRLNVSGLVPPNVEFAPSATTVQSNRANCEPLTAVMVTRLVVLFESCWFGPGTLREPSGAPVE